MKIPASAAAATLLALTATFAVAQQTHGGPSDGADMAHMDAIMERIRSVEDPDERAQLLEQHLDEMHAMMGRMHETMGQMMRHVEQQRTERRRLHDHRRMK